MKPNAAKHDPSPHYLRALVIKSGLSQRACARQIGIGERLLRYYLADELTADRRVAPYPVQFALEQLAR